MIRVSDSIKQLDLLRNLYKSQASGSNEMLRELKQITNEIKISNDLKAQIDTPITNATNSPYFKDQTYYRKEVLFGSPQEGDWKNVDSYEEAKRSAVVFQNLRRLNII